jgi:hypothetical protein
MVNEDRNVCGGPGKMGLSPWNVEVVQHPALIFGKTCKSVGPTQDGCGLGVGLVVGCGREGV